MADLRTHKKSHTIHSKQGPNQSSVQGPGWGLWATWYCEEKWDIYSFSGMMFLSHLKLQSWLSSLIFRLETDVAQSQSETQSGVLI